MLASILIGSYPGMKGETSLENFKVFLSPCGQKVHLSSDCQSLKNSRKLRELSLCKFCSNQCTRSDLFVLSEKPGMKGKVSQDRASELQRELADLQEQVRIAMALLSHSDPDNISIIDAVRMLKDAAAFSVQRSLEMEASDTGDPT